EAEQAEDAAKETEDTQAQTEETETEAQTEETEAQTEAAGGYEDNFAVDSAAAADFTRQIQAAVSEQDLEKLADLTAFPVYVDLPDGGKGITSREEFLELGADQIFTKELMDSVAAADVDALTPSMAGFVLSDGGTANIIFAVSDGALTVVGINY
ncbi:MAG TPA: hypothetical protein IAB28_09165, partial [Candidatus Copromonas faecavium]|nr:hypothetical protein [Candidatus Copromonas faecavium]